MSRKVRGPNGWDIEIPLHQIAHTTVVEDGIEYWDFYSDDFVIEAWEMTLGGIKIEKHFHLPAPCFIAAIGDEREVFYWRPRV